MTDSVELLTVTLRVEVRSMDHPTYTRAIDVVVDPAQFEDHLKFHSLDQARILELAFGGIWYTYEEVTFARCFSFSLIHKNNQLLTLDILRNENGYWQLKPGFFVRTFTKLKESAIEVLNRTYQRARLKYYGWYLLALVIFSYFVRQTIVSFISNETLIWRVIGGGSSVVAALLVTFLLICLALDAKRDMDRARRVRENFKSAGMKPMSDTSESSEQQ